MKAHSHTPSQSATPTAAIALHSPGFAVNVHGPIAGRLFDLLYAYVDVRVVDVDGAGAFLAPETALALADLIADDSELRARIVDTTSGLDGAA